MGREKRAGEGRRGRRKEGKEEGRGGGEII
jgi:hypothetical protein